MTEMLFVAIQAHSKCGCGSSYMAWQQPSLSVLQIVVVLKKNKKDVVLFSWSIREDLEVQVS